MTTQPARVATLGSGEARVATRAAVGCARRLDTFAARALVTADRTRVNGKLPDQTSLDLTDGDWYPSCRTGSRAWLLTPTMSRQVIVLVNAERCRSGLTERS